MAGTSRSLKARRRRAAPGRSRDDDDGLSMPNPAQNNVIAGVDHGANIPIQNLSHELAGDLSLEKAPELELELMFESLPSLDKARRPRRSGSQDPYSRKEQGITTQTATERWLAQMRAPMTQERNTPRFPPVEPFHVKVPKAKPDPE